MFSYFLIDLFILFVFFFNDSATTEIYTLSLHDALPISPDRLVDRAPECAPLLRGRNGGCPRAIRGGARGGRLAPSELRQMRDHEAPHTIEESRGTLDPLVVPLQVLLRRRRKELEEDRKSTRL